MMKSLRGKLRIGGWWEAAVRAAEVRVPIMVNDKILHHVEEHTYYKVNVHVHQQAAAARAKDKQP